MGIHEYFVGFKTATTIGLGGHARRYSGSGCGDGLRPSDAQIFLDPIRVRAHRRFNCGTEELIGRSFKIPLNSCSAVASRLRASHALFNSPPAVEEKGCLLVQGVQPNDVKYTYINTTDESLHPRNLSPTISHYLLRTFLQSPRSTVHLTEPTQ